MSREFLCLGGPLDRCFKTFDQVKGEGYVPYNRASGGWNPWTGREPHPTQVFIHLSVFQAAKKQRSKPR